MAEQAQTTTGKGFSFDLADAKGLVRHLPFPAASQLAKTNTADVFSLPTSSVLGTPLFFALKIAEVTLPNEPLITVSGSKTIVKTQVAGGDFTVKEMIGRDDWKINIKGYAVREGAVRDRPAGGLVPDDYPEEWLRALISLYNRNTALDCQCQLLSYFNISRLVIEDITFPAVAGAHGYFAYEINAMSDESSLAKLKLKRPTK
jgi:hypothetical protein